MPEARILVVEDESIIAMDIQDGLANLGYDVPVIASSGEEAIRLAEEIRPDLVLMDIVLGEEMDGIQAADRIYTGLNIPVIYLTAYSDIDTLQRAKITGPFGYILKPFEERELQTAIEMALYKHKMEKKLKESEQWLATTLRSIGDAVIAADSNSKITFMNPVAEELTGWRQEEAMGRDLFEVYKAVEGEKGDAFLRSKGGDKKPIDRSIAPIKDERGMTLGTVLVFRDITDRKRSEEELRAARNQLEMRVEERTAELARANEVLQGEIAERTHAEKALTASLKEKEVLLREIHHRVKNNLQIISSLIYLQSKKMGDEEPCEAFKESQNRIKSMALVHENLYRSENLAGIEMADYIQNLASYLQQSYGLGAGMISVDVHVDHALMGIDTAIPCGLIINEIVSNSYKHAFKGRERGEIGIDLHLEKDGRYRLAISDDGIGMNGGMDAAGMKTLGLQLVSTLVRQIDGEMVVERSRGTRFVIHFTELKYRERS